MEEKRSSEVLRPIELSISARSSGEFGI